MFHFVVFITSFYTVSCHIYGEKVGYCSNSRAELRAQICTEGRYGYVRLKTYDGRYVRGAGNSYLVTRASRGKPRPPITVPGVRTTFKVHCPSSGAMDVRFELLNQRPHMYPSPRYGDNQPSGYFFYAGGYSALYAKKNTNQRFRLYRWRGSIVGILVLRTGHWLGYNKNNAHGKLLVWDSRRSAAQYKKPAIYDTFTIESVPKECVDVVNKFWKIQAAPNNASPTECETKPDRCYWDTSVRMSYTPHPHKCYYKKDSMCWQVGPRSACPVTTANAETCEAANCCYDYETKSCYKGKRNV